MKRSNIEDEFPSFAPSPERQVSLLTDSPPLTKITITLPDSLVESTIDENTHYHPSKESQFSEKEEKGPNIQVYCRFRPARHSFNLKYDHSMIDDGENRYSFDRIFSSNATQSEIYSVVADRHLQSFLKGENSTLFTYGQTGSGKTYTMFGDLRHKEGLKSNLNQGLIPRCLQDIFLRKNPQDTITCSILQIYNQKLIDLFDPLKQGEAIKIKETADQTTLEGLVEVKVDNHQQVMELIRFGYRDRKIATTYNNDCSSRSHTILFVYRTYICQDKTYRNKLCFIDLAGSQKVRKSGVTGQTLEEAKKINLSLSCLGNVVSALTSGAEHVPYRNSKLTRILKDSLNGLTRTSIITTCSSEKVDSGQTLSTIRFAVRAKKIRNKSKLQNIILSSEEIIQSLRKELALTKKELEFYKKKEEERLEPEEIPQEAVVSRPIRGSQFSGVSSMVKISLLESTRSKQSQ